MKLIVLAVLCGLWVVNAENCNTAPDCTLTACVGGNRPVCINNVCTCTAVCTADQDLGRCQRASECQDRYASGRIQCICARPDLHCVDGECHCVHI